MVTLFNGADIKVEVANFCTAMDTLIDQDASYCTDSQSDKVSVLTYTCPHKLLRKITVTICNCQVDCPFNLWPNVWVGDLQGYEKNMVIYDTECP